ncbi:SatD family protein [Isoptericola sp. 4D.3]|uniref:SatD family protein n=1 Tax=Isoptericola peretonis TaxID=2918523 RepID=A0ABT0J222_9MICO|nr:SatD family protein [Isoptericola sp. 4D.3]
MIVVTADQRGSTGAADRVPEVLARIARRTERRPGVVLPFDRTVGDEVQGVLAADDDGAGLAVDLALDLVRDGGWSVGIGLGTVDLPLPASSREASGPAFVRARTAVDRAKRRGRPSVPLAVVGGEEEPRATIAGDAQALLHLLGAVVARRSAAGWEAVDTLVAQRGPAPQRASAAALGVSEQAVSQRLRAALWSEESAARPLAARLLRAAGAEPAAGEASEGGDDGEECER